MFGLFKKRQYPNLTDLDHLIIRERKTAWTHRFNCHTRMQRATWRPENIQAVLKAEYDAACLRTDKADEAYDAMMARLTAEARAALKASPTP